VAKTSRDSRLGRPRTGVDQKILDVAERLAQTRGFNGFSYADIAAALHVSKASLHYHFPSKAELGRALVARYHVVFAKALDEIDRDSADAGEKLRRYVTLYDLVLRKDRMCLCGMLAAEYSTLPERMQSELRRFFDLNERWIAGVLEEGRRTGSLSFQERPQQRSRALLGALEGAMLVARTYGDASWFRSAVEYALSALGAGPSKGSRKAVAISQ
jgi:TetR/AcrR family transcriptional regulator, transcriptional repressor for nem operon